MGSDRREAERLQRLLPAWVAIADAPSLALPELTATDVVLLEDRGWPEAEDSALAELRRLSASRRLALILSRRRGEAGESAGLPVVERPYRVDEIVDAMRLALLRRAQ